MKLFAEKSIVVLILLMLIAMISSGLFVFNKGLAWVDAIDQSLKELEQRVQAGEELSFQLSSSLQSCMTVLDQCLDQLERLKDEGEGETE